MYLCSGKLPFTIAKSVNDYSAQLITSGSGIVPIPYNEGIFIDYRHFDQVSSQSMHVLIAILMYDIQGGHYPTLRIRIRLVVHDI